MSISHTAQHDNDKATSKRSFSETESFAPIKQEQSDAGHRKEKS